ncbi:MAG: glycosyl hydrolase [Planctomycetota bacterium]
MTHLSLLRGLALVFASALPLPAQQVIDASLYEDLSWRCIGPFRGGRCTAVAGVAQQPFTFYFGSCGGGVWKTTDGGIGWDNVTDGFVKTGSVGAIAVAPSDPNVVYVGMGEAQVRGVTTSHGDGVYRSTDAGRTWKHCGLEATRHISSVQVDPRDPDRVFVAAQGMPWMPTSDRGIYVSEDGGSTWEHVLHVSDSAGCSSLSMDPTNPRVLYAGFWDHQRTPWQVRSGGEGSGIWKSTNSGEDWQELTEGLPELMGKVGVSVSPADPMRVWAIVEADEGGLFRSDDGGESWQRTNSDRVLRARAWYYTRVFADPVDENRVYVANAPLMRSIDGGRTFERVGTPHGDNHALWINPNDNDFLINGNDGGANVSFNGGESWSTQANQPTAQFYRVITDARFPYHVYGGQQDNSTVCIASRTQRSGIGERDWYPVAGGESAFLAFDPADPRLVYGGVYQGIVSELDVETGESRSVMAYPELGLGMQPRDQKYRFNWNAPLLASPQDPSILYHAAQVVLRSSDRGVTWTEISPDLTRNEVDRQGPGGAPITNEGAGGEIYNTISYLACSPHEAGTLWAGSDDGLVHVTRDGGTSWQNVTPPAIGEALINCIEVSPHDPAKAWLAVTRYKWGDDTPHVLVTEDYGQSWERRAGGIPDGAFVRAVREDPVREGLVYAGTELGAFISFDAGSRWQSLQQNLPTVPITDLTLRDGDLVAATQGRAFWILDDVGPLRALDDAEIADADLHLLAPRAAIRMGGGGWRSAPRNRGQNPPPGGVFHYVIGEELDTSAGLTLTVSDSEGGVVREYSSEDGEGSARLSTEPGMHRFVWDMSTEPVAKVPGQFLYGGSGAYHVEPGVYTVKLTCGETTLTQELELREDPRLEARDYTEQQDVMSKLSAMVDAMHEGVVALEAVREQIEAQRAGWDDEALMERADELAEAMTAWENEIVQRDQKTFQDVINFPNRLSANVLDLLGQLDGSGPIVNRGVRERVADLQESWQALEAEYRELTGPRLDELNAAIKKADIPAIRVETNDR